jgi:hypothetical protein
MSAARHLSRTKMTRSCSSATIWPAKILFNDAIERDAQLFDQT